MTWEPASGLLHLILQTPRTYNPSIDHRLLEGLALATLREDDLEPRIGQPLPLADALQDTEFDDDEITTGNETGEGARRFGRVIVHWDSHNFRAVDVHASIEEAIHAFESIREHHEGTYDEDGV